MLQGAHVVLDVLKFNNSMPYQIHALPLCKAASSQLRIRTI